MYTCFSLSLSLARSIYVINGLVIIIAVFTTNVGLSLCCCCSYWRRRCYRCSCIKYTLTNTRMRSRLWTFFTTRNTKNNTIQLVNSPFFFFDISPARFWRFCLYLFIYSFIRPLVCCCCCCSRWSFALNSKSIVVPCVVVCCNLRLFGLFFFLLFKYIFIYFACILLGSRTFDWTLRTHVTQRVERVDCSK